MSTTLLLTVVVVIIVMFLLIWLGKKYGFKKYFMREKTLTSGMRILWREIDKTEIKESTISAVTETGKYLKLDGKEWQPRADIEVLETLVVKEIKEPPKVKETPKVNVKRNVKA